MCDDVHHDPTNGPAEVEQAEEVTSKISYPVKVIYCPGDCFLVCIFIAISLLHYYSCNLIMDMLKC